MNKIRREVMKHERVKYSIHSHHGGTVLLYLDCGHVKRQKGGMKIPNHCYCKECSFSH